MNDLLLSVVIPVYNGEQYLRRAAESVLMQPCADLLELLLVDDGSRDRSGEICDGIAAEHSASAAVRVFHQENGGVSSARNLGIREAKGAYLAFLDADDWWMPSFFDASTVEQLEERFDVYQFSYQSVSPDLRWCKKNNVEDRAYRDLAPGDGRPAPVTHWSCLYRRELLERHQIKYLPCRINEDVPFVHLAFSLAKSAKTVDRLMLSYWSNPKSSLRPVRDTLEEALKSLKLEEDAFQKRGLSIDNRQTALSVFYTRLPRLCCQTSYRELKRYLAAPEYDMLRQDEYRPWSSLQKRENQYRKHPFLFWLKARITTGIPLKLRSLLLAIPFLRRFVYFVHFRLLRKWQPLKESSFPREAYQRST